MKSPKFWLRAAALGGVVALLGALPAVAANTRHFSGEGVEASFFSYNEVHGSSTSAFVFAGTFKDRFHDPPGGPPVTSSRTEVNVYLSQYFPGNPDDPSDDRWRDVFGYASPSLFRIDGRLQSATLEASIPATVCEYSPAVSDGPEPRPKPTPECTEVTLTVDLDWTGVGALTREGGSFHFRGDGFVVNGHFQGLRRSAEVAGVVSDGTTDYTGGAAGAGSIFQARQGEVIVD